MISRMKIAATLTVEADIYQLEALRKFIEETASSLINNTDALDDLILALNEAVTNVLVHGYRNTSGLIRIVVGTTAESLITILYDRAPPYDPTRTPAPDTTLPLEKRKPGGLGVHMMRHLTDEMYYRRTADGENELTLIKKTEPKS